MLRRPTCTWQARDRTLGRDPSAIRQADNAGVLITAPPLLPKADASVKRETTTATARHPSRVFNHLLRRRPERAHWHRRSRCPYSPCRRLGVTSSLWAERAAASTGLPAGPNVRGNAGPAVGCLAREADDEPHGFAGQVPRRWASR